MSDKSPVNGENGAASRTMRCAAWSSSGCPDDSSTSTSYSEPSRLIETIRRKLP
ncbi:hypothetical protein D3C81_2102910 [compost metagenome]